MRADIVVDASVLAKCFFHEVGSERARSTLMSGAVVAAPSLIIIEMVSIAVKKVRLAGETTERARDAVASIGDLVDWLVPLDGLAQRVFVLASHSRCSAFDAAYLAVAEDLGAPFLTADEHLIQTAVTAGMGGLVTRL